MTRADFMDAYGRWLNMPFPEGSEDDALDEVHAVLAYADAMLAEAAVPIAKGRAEVGQVPDQVVTELNAAMTFAEEYSHSADKVNARLAATYREYAEVLLTVIDELA